MDSGTVPHERQLLLFELQRNLSKVKQIDAVIYRFLQGIDMVHTIVF